VRLRLGGSLAVVMAVFIIGMVLVSVSTAWLSTAATTDGMSSASIRLTVGVRVGRRV
jgi:hypothetical protein